MQESLRKILQDDPNGYNEPDLFPHTDLNFKYFVTKKSRHNPHKPNIRKKQKDSSGPKADSRAHVSYDGYKRTVSNDFYPDENYPSINFQEDSLENPEELVVHPKAKRYYFYKSNIPKREYIRHRAQDYLAKVTPKSLYLNANPDLSYAIEELDKPFLNSTKVREKNINFADNIKELKLNGSLEYSGNGSIDNSLELDKGKHFLRSTIGSHFGEGIREFQSNTLYTIETKQGEDSMIRTKQTFDSKQREKRTTAGGGLKFYNIDTSELKTDTILSNTRKTQIKPHLPLHPAPKKVFHAKIEPLSHAPSDFSSLTPIEPSRVIERLHASIGTQMQRTVEINTGPITLEVTKSPGVVYKDDISPNFIGFRQTLTRGSPRGAKQSSRNKSLPNEKLNEIIMREQEASIEIQRATQQFPPIQPHKRNLRSLVPKSRLVSQR